MRRTFRIAPVLVTTAAGMYMVSPDTEGSCGSAFCTVNSDWTSESAITEPGSTLDLRYEYVRQDQPQTGTRKIAVGVVAACPGKAAFPELSRSSDNAHNGLNKP